MAFHRIIDVLTGEIVQDEDKDAVTVPGILSRWWVVTAYERSSRTDVRGIGSAREDLAYEVCLSLIEPQIHTPVWPILAFRTRTEAVIWQRNLAKWAQVLTLDPQIHGTGTTFEDARVRHWAQGCCFRPLNRSTWVLPKRHGVRSSGVK